MVFSSTIFLLYFLPIFLLAYHLIGKRYKNICILIASVLFYSWGAPKFVFVILGSTILDYYIVRLLYQSKEQTKRKLLLAASITTNLGLLLFFKYANFFVENVNEVLSIIGFNNLAWTKIALPIGISFYTFQTLTHSIDIYRGLHAPLNKLTDYLMYIMSFPQMIAGPIVRYNSIADQITNRVENIDDKLMGFFRFCIGLAKKVLIANVLGEQADIIINGDMSSLNAGAAWLGILAYTFQIYFDFSGYSDMAIGLGKIMGFKFPENFDNPYNSIGITEFWKKWHITLGSFMRDYLYIPLGGNRVQTKSRLFFNLWLVFLLSGLWHGAAWNFVLWGIYHGIFLILDRLFLLKLFKKIGRIPSVILTFLIVMVGWIIFRIEDLHQAKMFLFKMFDFSSNIAIPETISSFYIVLCFAILFSFICLSQFGKRIQDYIYYKKSFTNKECILFTMVSLILLVVSVSYITSSGFNPFIYFRF